MYPTSVYAEMTPNPGTMKFVSSRVIYTGENPVEYKNAAEVGGRSKLALELFNFPFVRGVFVDVNYVTITKSGDLDWDFITFELREFIRQFLLKNEWAATPEARTEASASAGSADSSQTLQTTGHRQTEAVNILPSEHDEVIVALLDEYVKPAVASDGGAIDFVSFADGVVTVKLRGSCSGCPSSTRTLKQGIEKILTAELPQVKAVVAEEA